MSTITLTNLLFISFDTHIKASSSTTTATENPATSDPAGRLLSAFGGEVDADAAAQAASTLALEYDPVLTPFKEV